MRHVSVILCLYLLLLVAGPCTDNYCCDPMQPDATHHEHGDTKNSHEQDADGCSPLCNCSCCGYSFIAITKYVIPSAILAFKVDTRFVVPNQPVEGISLPIWRPPCLIS